MKKFSKILESNEETLLSKIGSSEDEIKDICSDMTDEGYKVEIVTKYLGLDGRTYYNDKGTIEYYPCISVALTRKDNKPDDSDESTDDVRNWDGGVYYEGDINILKTIYNVCARFESTFTSDDAEVYFSIRSINDIVLRICLRKVIGDAKVKFRELHDTLGSLEINDDFYKCTGCWSEGNGTTTHVEIKPKSSKIENIIQKIISNGSSDDYHYLNNIMSNYTISIFNKTKELSKSDVKITYKLLGTNQSYDFISKIYADGAEIVEIKATYKGEDLDIVISKSLFKEKTKKITIHDIDVKVVINYQ